MVLSEGQRGEHIKLITKSLPNSGGVSKQKSNKTVWQTFESTDEAYVQQVDLTTIIPY